MLSNKAFQRSARLTVGAAVGIAVVGERVGPGVRDGIGVGSTETNLLGLEVGELDGCPVGCPVGLERGCSDGWADGWLDGRPIGCEVGSTEG